MHILSFAKSSNPNPFLSNLHLGVRTVANAYFGTFITCLLARHPLAITRRSSCKFKFSSARLALCPPPPSPHPTPQTPHPNFSSSADYMCHNIFPSTSLHEPAISYSVDAPRCVPLPNHLSPPSRNLPLQFLIVAFLYLPDAPLLPQPLFGIWALLACLSVPRLIDTKRNLLLSCKFKLLNSSTRIF
jgi:hypothetical protein